jgi:hypothetical protein
LTVIGSAQIGADGTATLSPLPPGTLLSGTYAISASRGLLYRPSHSRTNIAGAILHFDSRRWRNRVGLATRRGVPQCGLAAGAQRGDSPYAAEQVLSSLNSPRGRSNLSRAVFRFDPNATLHSESERAK